MASSDETGGNKKRSVFLPGQSGNPAGRPKGARSKLSEAFLDDLLVAWESQGPVVIQRVIEKRPQDFLKVVASLMPKDLNLNVDRLEGMTDEQLIAKIRSLDAVIRPMLEHIDDDDAQAIH